MDSKQIERTKTILLRCTDVYLRNRLDNFNSIPSERLSDNNKEIRDYIKLILDERKSENRVVTY